MSVPDHCLSFYFTGSFGHLVKYIFVMKPKCYFFFPCRAEETCHQRAGGFGLSNTETESIVVYM